MRQHLERDNHERSVIAVSDYRLIPLHGKYGEGKFAKVDAQNYPLLSRYKWRYSAPGYAVTRLYVGDNIELVVTMHRFILNPPAEIEVDHQDGDGLNNTESNLRLATRSQNARNRQKHAATTSKYKGVWLQKNRAKPWRSEIVFQGKKYSLGAFMTEEEAAHAYNDAAVKFHGEFARLNLL